LGNKFFRIEDYEVFHVYNWIIYLFFIFMLFIFIFFKFSKNIIKKIFIHLYLWKCQLLKILLNEFSKKIE
jgi:hypothetical protein